jgi:hypothetical protein
VDDAFHARPPLLSNFASFESYSSALPRLPASASGQALRPIAPTPLQLHQQNYYATRDPSYIPSGSPFTPAIAGENFLGDQSTPRSANISGTFQSGSRYLPGEGREFAGPGWTQRHASIAVPNSGYQGWTGAFNADPLHHTRYRARSNTLASFNPLSSDYITQSPDASLAPISQFPSPVDDHTLLTSTQIAALNGQPLPPDHPFYSEVRAHIHESESGTTSTGKSFHTLSTKIVHFESLLMI